MNASQLWETTLDPEKRELIQLTMDDIDRELEIFTLLHNPNEKNRKERSKLMSTFKINIDDIDN